MFFKLFRHELKRLLRDGSAALVILGLIAAIGIGCFTGARTTRQQEGKLAEQRAIERKALANLREEIRTELEKLRAEGKPPVYPEWGPRHPYYAGAFRARPFAMRPAAPLAATAIGASDVNPPSYSVSTGLKETFLTVESIESPYQLAAGGLDLAFVVVFVLPLVILAVSYDLGASERENGMLGLLAVSGASFPAIVAAKLSARAALVLPAFLVGGLAVGAFAGARLAEAPAQTLLWCGGVAAYAGFWFALAAVIAAFKKSPATNAVIGAVAYLAIVIVWPAALNLAAVLWSPPPSRVEFVNAVRRESLRAEQEGSQLLGKYLEDHPELRGAENGKAEKEDFAMLDLARDAAVEARLEPLLARFEERRTARRSFGDATRYLSPATLAYVLLGDLAGNGRHRHERFLAAVGAFHKTWRDWFAGRVFQKIPTTEADLDRFPKFAFTEESAGELARRVTPPLVWLAVLAVLAGFGGFLKIRRDQ
jgi:ABC-2 type transport system permease protein